MNINIDATKVTIYTAVSVILAKLGSIGYILIFLCVFMLFDFITGLTASYVEKVEQPNDDSKGLKSKRGIIGIIKKFAYLCVIAVGMGLDLLLLHYGGMIGLTIPINTFFGTLLAFQFVVNEVISILENCVKMGVDVPDWILRLANVLKISVEKKSEEAIDKIENTSTK